MTELLPLLLLFAAWIPLAALVTWFFEGRPRLHARRTAKARKANA